MSMESMFVAGGEIRVSRFVKHSTTYDQTVLEADANERTFGISQTGAKDAPGLSGSSASAATADGDSLKVFLIGERAPLTIGSGGCTAGQMLKSDADGKGVAVSLLGNDNQWVGAIAEESGSENETIYVRVVCFPYRHGHS